MLDHLSVLLVDDDDFVRKTIEQLLRTMGVENVQTAGDGAGALRLAAEAPVDLIIADLMMPGVDGVELMRSLADRHSRAALVLISSLDNSVLRSVAVLARERGLRVLGALRKPVRQEALSQLLQPLARDDGEDSPEPAPPPRRTLPDAAALEHAMERGDLKLVAQPIINMDERDLHSVDLRICWPRGRDEVLEHAQISALAARHKLTGMFFDYVLARTVFAAGSCWEQGLRAPLLASMPGAALRRSDLPDLLDRQLREAGAMPELFRLAVAETELQDDSSTLEVLSRLRMRQINVCLDQFAGRTGYARLQRLPVTSVRINGRLLRLGDRARDLVKHAIENARSLGFECYAESVDTEELATELDELGCIALQGPVAGESGSLDDIIETYRDTDFGDTDEGSETDDTQDAN